MKKTIFVINNLLLMMMFLIGCGRSNNPVTTPPTISLITITSASSTATVGTAIQFTATATYSDNTTKDITTETSWTSSNTAVGTINSSGIFTAISSGTTTIEAVGAQNSIVVTVSSTMLNNQPPVASASANKTSGTAPLTIQFTGNGSDPDGSITSYYWEFGDGNTSNEQNPIHTYTLGSSFTALLTVTDNNGATNIATIDITTQNALPIVNPSANLTSGNIPLTVQFTDGASDPNGTIASYNWNFGDGQTSTEQNPVHTYTSSGTFTVTLTVKDNEGATNQAMLSITAMTSTIKKPIKKIATGSGFTCALFKARNNKMLGI